MPKILVVSDLHYPTPRSELLHKIIKGEKPDMVVLLGDVIDNSGSGRKVIDLYREFVSSYRKSFPLSKSVMLLGDNDGRNPDYSISSEVASFLEGLGIANKDLITYRDGNMFFFHGNLEDSFIKEKMGYYAGKIAVKLSRRLMPALLLWLVRRRFKLSGDTILFIGHLHYLGIIGKGVVCGTLHSRKILYGKKDSMGYVLLDYNGRRLGVEDVKIARL